MRSVFHHLLLCLCCSLRPSTQMSTTNPGRSMMQRVRVELFFKDKSELRERVNFLHGKGVNAFNLVNKDKKDKLSEWVSTIKEEAPDCSISAHWSLKYNKVAERNGGDDASYEKFSTFVNSAGTECSDGENGNVEVLLVSGSGEKKSLDAVNALKRLQQDRCVQAAPSDSAKLCVAFNPFFPDQYDLDVEKDRLQEKIDTEQVSKVYLQFGTDVEGLKSGLDFICNMKKEKGLDDLDICGSIFLPTKKLIAQQKFRPWNGVFLSDEFLSGEKGARNIVTEMMKVYDNYGAEMLFEAPGIRTEKDVSVMMDLLANFDGNGSDSTKGTDGSSSDDSKSKNNGRGRRNKKGTESKQPSKKARKAASMAAKEAKRDKQSQLAEEAEPSAPAGQQMRPSPLVDTSSLSAPCILLFGSHDVRLHDNRAVECASFHPSAIPTFLWSNVEEGEWGVKGATEVVLKAALKSLDNQLKDNGMLLLCRDTQDSTNELLSLCKETGARVVYSNMEHTPENRIKNEERKEVLDENGIKLVLCNSSLLYNPQEISISTGFNGGHFATLMPFLKTCKQQLGNPPTPPSREESRSMLAKMKGPKKWPSGTKIDDMRLAVINGKERWDAPILDRFPMSEDQSEKLLNSFMDDGLKGYESQRSRADLEGATSRLSAHLRVGTLSPYELYWHTEQSSLPYDAKKTFSRRLFWRDLAYFQLYYFPHMRAESIRQHYENTAWVDGEEEDKRLRAWKKGMTGYPLVDAAMRELWATGWMTQSVRMVAASFLTEYLRVNWVKGCEWFHYTLVDADSAINPMMWQNAGRCGIDQWNFVMSPENGSQDASGEYTKKWVPELSKLPKAHIHQPWKASEDVLREAGVILGETYPHRIVNDLKAERQKSVEAVLDMRRNSQQWNDDSGYDIIELPTGGTTKVFTKKEYRIDRAGVVMKIEKTSAESKRGGRGRKGAAAKKGGNKKAKKRKS